MAALFSYILRMKVIVRIICWFTLIACCIATVKLKPKTQRQSETAKAKNTILTLWHIDTFEGGIGSRQDFLSKASIRFEKRYDGVFVCVIGYTIEEAEENMNNGVYPDMISYGIGFDNYRNMREIRADSKYFCSVNGKKAAVGWCRGGYVILSHEKNVVKDGFANVKTVDDSYSEENLKIVISKGKHTNPEIALAVSGISTKNYEIKSHTEAYACFLKDKTVKLLGTQRDVWRLENRQVPFKIDKVFEFSELVQYISVYTRDENKNFYSQKFIEYLLSEESQKRLTQIGMLAINGESIYGQDDAVRVIEDGKINGGLYIFTDKEKIEKLQTEATRIIEGEEKNLNKLKDFLQWK